jgi:hypothetical protein
MCTSPNSYHVSGPSSCTPPVASSNYLTVGTADANGAGTKSIGSAQYTVKGTSPEDVLIDYDITDVRCRPALSGCGSANVADGPDYTGTLVAYAVNRISDHASYPGPSTAGTMQDISFLVWAPVSIYCVETAADTTIGGECSVATSANAIDAGSIRDTDRMIAQKVSSLQVQDGGADSNADTYGDNTLFMEEGVFVP